MCCGLTCLCSSPKGFAQLFPWGSWSTDQGLHVCFQAGWLLRSPLVHWSTMTEKRRTLKTRFGNLNPELLIWIWNTLEQLLHPLPSGRGVWQTARRGLAAPGFRGCVPAAHQLQPSSTTAVQCYPLVGLSPAGAGRLTSSNTASHLGEAAEIAPMTSQVLRTVQICTLCCGL